MIDPEALGQIQKENDKISAQFVQANYKVKPVEKATFSEMLARAEGKEELDNQDKLYLQMKFVDQETQDEFHKVDSEFVRNAGGLTVDGEDLLQLKSRWVDDDQALNDKETNEVINDI